MLHHLKHNIEDPRSTILIVGFQAADTLGRRLVERRPEVRILGRIFALQGGGGRAQRPVQPRRPRRAVACLGPLAAAAQRVRLVHGEPERAEALAAGLRTAGFADVAVAERGESVVV